MTRVHITTSHTVVISKVSLWQISCSKQVFWNGLSKLLCRGTKNSQWWGLETQWLAIETWVQQTKVKLTSLRKWKRSSSSISSELAEISETLVHLPTVQRSLLKSCLYGRFVAWKDISQILPHLFLKTQELRYTKRFVKKKKCSGICESKLKCIWHFFLLKDKIKHICMQQWE